MKGRIILVLLLLAPLFACSGTSEPSESTVHVVIYGSPRCSLCMELKDSLESRGVGYEFVDLTADEQALRELSRELAAESWFAGKIEMPIVEVGEQLLRRPSADEVVESMANDNAPDSHR